MAKIHHPLPPRIDTHVKTQKEMPTSHSTGNWKCCSAPGPLRGTSFTSAHMSPHQAFADRLVREQQFTAPQALPVPPPCLTFPPALISNCDTVSLLGSLSHVFQLECRPHVSRDYASVVGCSCPRVQNRAWH